jgi:hypothetical protein
MTPLHAIGFVWIATGIAEARWQSLIGAMVTSLEFTMKARKEEQISPRRAGGCV